MLGWLVHRWASLGVQHGYVDKFFPVSNLASLEAGWAVGEGLGSGPISIACDLGGSPPGCFPICEMGTRKCHSRVSWVFNRGLWLRCWNSPGDWEAHLFCTIQSRQMTQISLTLLNIKVRKKLSLKHLSWGKQPLEYESFFFQVQTRANYQWSQNGVGFFFSWFDFYIETHQIQIWTSTALHAIFVVGKQPMQWSEGNILTIWDGNVSIISCWNRRWNRYIFPKCLDFIKLPLLASSNSSNSVGLV